MTRLVADDVVVLLLAVKSLNIVLKNFPDDTGGDEDGLFDVVAAGNCKVYKLGLSNQS